MMLTPASHADLDRLLPPFFAALEEDLIPWRALFAITRRIPNGSLMELSTDPVHHREAIALCRRFELGLIDLAPQQYFTWDGDAAAIRIEPSVLIHEVAHYQCATAERRLLPDFGLGAGPETGRKDEANAVQQLFCPERDVEEALTSLLGILWEAELGQPAILAFLEQNWLEGGTKSVAHFRKCVHWLLSMGLIDDDARPTQGLRSEDDPSFFSRWFAQGSLE